MGESNHPPSAAEDRPRLQVPFHAHVELLQLFLTHRDEIVEKIQGLLNAQREPIQYLQDVPRLSRQFVDCFFTFRGITRDQSRLKRQLEEAHWASGFKPRVAPGLHNDLVDPAEMMSRAFGMWQHTHWPGHSGRGRYAQTLFNLHVIRQLALLVMRLWDDRSDGSTDRVDNRLSLVQGVLNQLWKTSPADQPVLVRDVRWLIPVAQSPTTDELSGYFEVAEQVAETLAGEDESEIQNASVRMAGGHLRSQLRHLSVQKSVSIDEKSLVLSTRTSNALDLALLVQGLVVLLRAYEQASQNGDAQKRLELADAVYQGISPDPELFLNRLDLLGAYSMIEHLFITTERDGQAAYSPMGLRHLRLLEEYKARIARSARALCEDCQHFRPIDGIYSPYGVLYGFSSNLIEHMALKTLQPDAVTQFSLEDVFSGGDNGKLAWVSGWRKLPHIKRDVARLFEYPQQFAEDMFGRIESALHKHTAGGDSGSSVRTGRLFVLAGDDVHEDSKMAGIADLPVRYIRSSDVEIVAAQRAESCEQTQLLHSRLEGEFIVSYRTAGGWVAISKDVLTEVLGAGQDAKVVGIPPVDAEVLMLMCPGLGISGTDPNC